MKITKINYTIKYLNLRSFCQIEPPAAFPARPRTSQLLHAMINIWIIVIINRTIYIIFFIYLPPATGLTLLFVRFLIKLQLYQRFYLQFELRELSGSH